jgi:hypothetical protein
MYATMASQLLHSTPHRINVQLALSSRPGGYKIGIGVDKHEPGVRHSYLLNPFTREDSRSGLVVAASRTSSLHGVDEIVRNVTLCNSILRNRIWCDVL